MNKHDRREKTLHHIHRIEGQLQALKTYIQSGKSCQEIAMLSTSIAKSFDTLRARTLEGYITHEILEGTEIPDEKLNQLHELFELYKK